MGAEASSLKTCFATGVEFFEDCGPRPVFRGGISGWQGQAVQAAQIFRGSARRSAWGSFRAVQRGDMPNRAQSFNALSSNGVPFDKSTT